MPFAEIGELELFYKVEGSGPRVLYIGGTAGDLRRYPTVFHSPLPEMLHVLSFDQRGMGQSSKPDVACSMADYAEDAVRLLDVLGWSQTAVWGFSFGGMVAQELALRHPERVSRLILAGTSSGGAGGHSYPLHELEDLGLQEKAERMVYLSDLRRDEAWRKAHPKVWDMLVATTKDMLRPRMEDPQMVTGARHQLEARRHHDTFDRLHQLHMPVLVCGGTFDGLASTENVEALHQAIPGSRLQWYQGGHLFQQQDRTAFPNMAAFITEHL